MLTIYKASAGSGKTFTLVLEILTLLLKEKLSFKEILAVTFTNKATNEMKSRVLKELYKLSTDALKSDYYAKLVDLGCKDIQKNAHSALVEILHNYTSFNISTIDKFFQKIVRNFSVEIGKISNYTVDLNTSVVLYKVIDEFYSKLGEKSYTPLFNWIKKIVLEKIANGESWQIDKSLYDIGKEVFNEKFKLLDSSAKIDFNTISKLKGSLLQSSKTIDDTIYNYAENISNIISANGLDYTDFKGGRTRSKMLAIKKVIETKRDIIASINFDGFRALNNGIEEWFTREKLKDDKYINIYNNCIDPVKKLIEYIDNNSVEAFTNRAILAVINELALIGFIKEGVDNYCKANNVMLLPQSTELINKLISETDAPFIYEKIGTRIKSFLLDEFQDTSIMQWANFWPLIANSLADGNRNLIVGDEKQSIYRWRGSDWKLLNSKAEDDVKKINNKVAVMPLNENWRSCKNIIEFNNDFFSFLVKKAVLFTGDDTVKDIYKSLAQSLPVKKSGGYNGYVAFENIRGGKKPEFEEVSLNKIVDTIKDLKKRGYRGGDIAILVRNNDDIKLIANRLLKEGINIVSSESLYIAQNSAVQTIISILKEQDNPNDDLNNLYKSYLGVNMEMKSLNNDQLSLYQKAEHIINLYLSDEQKRENMPYIQGFLDVLLNYINNEGANLHEFLNWWNSNSSKLSIYVPDGTDGVNIMTIHASKGLEFKVVITPFISGGLVQVVRNSGYAGKGGEKRDPKTDFIWVVDNDTKVALKFNKDLENSKFKKIYINEFINKCIDTINLLYVTFTRAERELYIFAREEDATIASYINEFFIKEKGITPTESIYYIDSKDGKTELIVDSFSIGEREDFIENVVKSANEIYNINYIDSILSGDRYKTALSSVASMGEDSARLKGISLHELFSLIKDYDSIEQGVESALLRGLIKDREETLNFVTEQIENVKSYGWFNPGLEVLNEVSILCQDGTVKRPDRVVLDKERELVMVVDYKFGEVESNSVENKYIRQISGYKANISAMGYKNVRGFIWYVNLNKVTEC